MRCCRRVVLIVAVADAQKQLGESKRWRVSQSPRCPSGMRDGEEREGQAQARTCTHTPERKTTLVSFPVGFSVKCEHEQACETCEPGLKIDVFCFCLNDGVTAFFTGTADRVFYFHICLS